MFNPVNMTIFKARLADFVCYKNLLEFLLYFTFRCDFIVYKDINSVPIKATENDYEKKVLLW